MCWLLFWFFVFLFFFVFFVFYFFIFLFFFYEKMIKRKGIIKKREKITLINLREVVKPRTTPPKANFCQKRNK